jgi:hypothetical protein
VALTSHVEPVITIMATVYNSFSIYVHAYRELVYRYTNHTVEMTNKKYRNDKDDSSNSNNNNGGVVTRSLLYNIAYTVCIFKKNRANGMKNDDGMRKNNDPRCCYY